MHFPLVPLGLQTPLQHAAPALGLHSVPEGKQHLPLVHGVFAYPRPSELSSQQLLVEPRVLHPVLPVGTQQRPPTQPVLQQSALEAQVSLKSLQHFPAPGPAILQSGADPGPLLVR
jgi:hypothetical protein